MTPKSRTDNRHFLRCSLLFLLATSTYILAFPIASFPGFGFLSLISIALFLLWMKPLNLGQVLAGGTFAGALIHAAVTSWIGNYHPAALILSMLAGALRFSLLFSGLHLVSQAKPWLRRTGSILIVTSIPILASWGFLAFPYATLPYSMGSSRLALFLASIGGTSLVTLVIAVINYCFFETFQTSRSKGKPVWILWFAPAMVFGIIFLIPTQPYLLNGNEPINRAASTLQKKKPAVLRIALVQPNRQTKQENLADYKAMFASLKELSGKAGEYTPDLIIWHETSIVPALAWHIKYRPDRESYEFAKDVQQYLVSNPSSILLGTSWVSETDENRKSEYNSALLYSKTLVSGIYSKMKLVPFSEYFPFSRQLPGLSRWLVSRFGLLRTPGTQATVFTLNTATFAAPICFEDSFTSHFLSYPEVDFFAVLTDDSWARSVSMQKQHAVMSKFRAAETGSILLRAANTGDTMVIEPNGHIAMALTPQTADFLIVDITPGAKKRTIFERFGHYLPIIVFVASLCFFATAVYDHARNASRRRRNID